MSKNAIGEAHDMVSREISFDEWLNQVPESICNERFWKLTAYRKALYLFDLTWQDTQNWLRDVRGQALARQIAASADSVCANIEEGYGRGFGRQLLYFYTVALGSARETKGRLYRAKALLSPDILQECLSLASEVVALLLVEINRQKQR